MIRRFIFLNFLFFGLLISNEVNAGLFGPSNTQECIKEYLPKTRSDFAAKVVLRACRSYYQGQEKKRSRCIFDLDELFEAQNDTAARIIFTNSECTKITEPLVNKDTSSDPDRSKDLELFNQAEYAAMCISGPIREINKYRKTMGEGEIDCSQFIYKWYRSGLTHRDAGYFLGQHQDVKPLKKVYSTRDDKWQIEFCAKENSSKCVRFPSSEIDKKCTENWCSFCNVNPEKAEIDTCTVETRRKSQVSQNGIPSVVDFSLSTFRDGSYFLNTNIVVNGKEFPHAYDNSELFLAEKLYVDNLEVTPMSMGHFDDPDFAPFIMRLKKSKKIAACYTKADGKTDCVIYPSKDFHVAAERTGDLMRKYLLSD